MVCLFACLFLSAFLFVFHTNQTFNFSSSVFDISVNAIPIDYVVPSFPSLYFPIGSPEFKSALLFYPYDIWKFTLYWTFIFFASFHLCASIWASIMHRKSLMDSIYIILFYLIFSGIQALISGSLVGLFIGALYRSGTFGMTTWLPFSWGAIQILFQVVTSYSMMSTLL